MTTIEKFLSELQKVSEDVKSGKLKIEHSPFELLPKQHLETFAKYPIYSQAKNNDPLILAVYNLIFFLEDGSVESTNFTYVVTEIDIEKEICFGLVYGHENEFGYFALNEIKAISVDEPRRGVIRAVWDFDFTPLKYTIGRAQRLGMLRKI